MRYAFCIFLLFGIRGSFSEESQLPDNQPFTEITITLCEIPKFSKENLQQYLISKRILHPEIAYAQAVLETGNFTSRIFKENNNLFGMKLAVKRRTLAIGERYGHACYDNWQDSVDDYLLWQQMWVVTPIESERDYYRLLDNVYATDEHYVTVLKRVKRRNKLIRV
jgi:flagellum-specific peptidoglycan hydrolase FlgJ